MYQDNNQWSISKDKISGPVEDYTHLTEDLYQASLSYYTVDSGWYGNDPIDPQGKFVTYVIKDFDWDSPLLRMESISIPDTIWCISMGKAYCESKLRSMSHSVDSKTSD
jgi:hypothetical protein